MSYYCYFNGTILNKDQIQVNVADLSLMRGYGVFDFLRTYNGVPFRVNDYLDRFYHSAKEMMLTVPLSGEKLITTLEEVLKKNKIGPGSDIGVRFLLTGGYSMDGYTVEVPNFFILIEDLPNYPAWQFENGIRLNLWEHQRELPLVKTINYLTAIKLSETLKKSNVQDTLYYHNNKILECTRNNFFLFHGSTLVTADKNVLQGISRKTVLELAGKIFKVEPREIELSELDHCTECFITGSTRGVCPVVNVNEKNIQGGKVGEHTKKLMEMFFTSTK